MEQDSLYTQVINKKYSKLADFLVSGRGGTALSGSPPGLIWYHHNRPGFLELVDRTDPNSTIKFITVF